MKINRFYILISIFLGVLLTLYCDISLAATKIYDKKSAEDGYSSAPNLDMLSYSNTSLEDERGGDALSKKQGGQSAKDGNLSANSMKKKSPFFHSTPYPQAKWSKDFPLHFSTKIMGNTLVAPSHIPLFHGDHLYVISALGEIIALNKVTKNITWSNKELAEANKVSTKRFYRMGGLTFSEIQGRPVIIASFGSNKILCLDAKSGHSLWLTQLPLPCRSTPVVVGDKVILTSANSEIFSLDLYTGKIKWSIFKYDNALSSLSNINISKNIQENEINTNNIPTIIAQDSKLNLVALGKDLQNPIWTINYPILNNNIPISNRVPEILVLIDPAPGSNLAFAPLDSSSIIAFNRANGEIIWKKYLSLDKKFALSDNSIFILNSMNILMALDKHTGNILWKKKIPAAGDAPFKFKQHSWASPLYFANKLFIPHSKGFMVVFDAKSGEFCYKFKINYNVNTTPIIAEGMLWTISNNGFIHGYSLPKKL